MARRDAAVYDWLAAAERGDLVDEERAVTKNDFFGPTGGPLFSDVYRGQRVGSVDRLVEQYKAIAFFCIRLKVRKLLGAGLRLYATTGTGQRRPRVASRRCDRAERRRLSTLSYLSRDMASADDVDEIVEHPLLDALDNPEGLENGKPKLHALDRAGLIELAYVSLEVAGTGYWHLPRTTLGPPVEIEPINPAKVDWDRDARSRVTRFIAHGSVVPVEEMLVFRYRSLRDPFGPGYGPLEASFAYNRLEERFASVQDQILGRGPRPSFMVGPSDPKMPFGGPEADRLRADLRRIAARYGDDFVVTNSGYKMDPLSWKPTDLAGLELSAYDLERICNAFGVPVSLASSETNLANLQAAESQLAESVEADASIIASTLTKLAKRLDPRLFFAFDEVSEEDDERKARVADIRLKNGTLTINEDRVACGYEEVEWGDEPWLPGTLRQPSEERPQPQPPGAPGEGPPGNQPPGNDEGDDQADDKEAERRLVQLLMRRLEREESSHENDDPARGFDDLYPSAPRQHLQEPVRRRAEADPEGVVQATADQDAGHGEVDRGTAAGDGSTQRHGLDVPDGDGDDADPGAVVERGGEEGVRPAGIEPGRLEGHEPVSGVEDPGSDSGVLRSDEPEDDAGSSDGAGSAQG